MTGRMVEPWTERLGLGKQSRGRACALGKLEHGNRHLLDPEMWTILLHLWTALQSLYGSFWMEELSSIGWVPWGLERDDDRHLFLALWNKLNKIQSAVRRRAPLKLLLFCKRFSISSTSMDFSSGSLTTVIRTFEKGGGLLRNCSLYPWAKVDKTHRSETIFSQLACKSWEEQLTAGPWSLCRSVSACIPPWTSLLVSPPGLRFPLGICGRIPPLGTKALPLTNSWITTRAPRPSRLLHPLGFSILLPGGCGRFMTGSLNSFPHCDRALCPIQHFLRVWMKDLTRYHWQIH